MNKQAIELEKLFQQLSQRLQSAQMWDDEPPQTSSLQSVQPFAVDTLAPEQWLQWVFMPKMKHLMDNHQPLPSGFSIAPYFEEVWKDDSQMQTVLDVIRAIDEVCRC